MVAYLASSAPSYHRSALREGNLASAPLSSAENYPMQGDLFAPRVAFQEASLDGLGAEEVTQLEARLSQKTWCWREEGRLCVNLQDNFLAGAGLLVQAVYQNPALKDAVAFKDKGRLRDFDDVVRDLNTPARVPELMIEGAGEPVNVVFKPDSKSATKAHIYITTALRGGGRDPQHEMQGRPLPALDGRGQPVNLILAFESATPRSIKNMVGANLMVQSSFARMQEGEDGLGGVQSVLKILARHGCYAPIAVRADQEMKESYHGFEL